MIDNVTKFIVEMKNKVTYVKIRLSNSLSENLLQKTLIEDIYQSIH